MTRRIQLTALCALGIALLGLTPVSTISRLPVGTYRCAVYGGSVMVYGGGTHSSFTGGSTAGSNLILDGRTYRFGAPSLGYRTGAYTYDPSSGRVTFTGFLARAYAKGISSFGTPAVNFPFARNRTALDGRPLAGGPMSCYYKR